MGRKKKDVKKKDNPKKKVEDTRSPEMKAIDKKLTDLQNRYRVAIKNKQDFVQKLNALNEEITKMSGAYQSLMELKSELTPKPEPEKDTETTGKAEENKAEDTKEEEKKVETTKEEEKKEEAKE